MDWNYWISDFLGGPLLGGITAILQGRGDLDATFSGLKSQPFVVEGLKLFLFGIFLKHLFDSFLETGRRLFEWIDDRFRPRLTVSAEFKDGDVTYAWVMTYMLNAKIWQNPRHIFVKSKSFHRKWKFLSPNNLVDYVPHYGAVQFFRWKNYWMEISRTKFGDIYRPHMGDYEKNEDSYTEAPSLLLKIYTRNSTALYEFVEECRINYLETMRNNVVVHTATTERFSSTPSRWSEARVKRRRPLESLLLGEGMIEDLLQDAREFLDSESWNDTFFRSRYQAAGIPYRRGYLLYGPPGTGKTSTVYTLAGELGLEIYSFSLASHGWDDSALAGVVSQIPPKAILLIEDIDCAFPSREEQEQAKKDPFAEVRRSSVTLSGVLNVLDGVGSEEGRLFIATTNYIEKLDPALIRPGRIDRKLQYKYTNKRQMKALFMRFFHTLSNLEADRKMDISTLADVFTGSIPEETFSVAELQGFLLLWKRDPNSAVNNIKLWVEEELSQKRAEEERKKKEKEERLRELALSAQVNYNGSPVTQPMTTIAPSPSNIQPPRGSMTPGDDSGESEQRTRASEDSHSDSVVAPEIQMEARPSQVNGAHKADDNSCVSTVGSAFI